MKKLHYKNPVYPYYFADPFVWKHAGVYYAVGTGPVNPKEHAREEDMTSTRVGNDELAFPLLVSQDLVHWQFHGGALKVPTFAQGGAFWAPEVAYANGFFYLYYSVATEGLKHRLRVARSASPTGPYEDIGLLTAGNEPDPFSIDAHPFQDEDGSWYLFYARDFLEVEHSTRVGTALVVDRLVEMNRLEGRERVVLRARSEWQRFQANRLMYGKICDWHTLEGPCVRKKNGKYYCFYSGGCYENASYGVDYGVADQIFGPFSDVGNEEGPRVLKTVPGKVIGPGHHSIVQGSDGVTDFIVYHAWDPDMTGRRLCIDPLVWTPEGPRCQGPSWTPQEILVP